MTPGTLSNCPSTTSDSTCIAIEWKYSNAQPAYRGFVHLNVQLVDEYL